MRRSACLLVAALLIVTHALAWGREQAPKSAKALPDGVYAVLREGLTEKDMLPLQDTEALAVNRHRYLKKDKQEPPRFLVVRGTPDVELNLAGEPKAVEEGGEVVRILLKLQPKAATALERLTTVHREKQIAILIGGEVVTVHKVRNVIKGGDVQITSCAAGGANYLLEQLRVHQQNR
jgi:preprotein translocase subunit SecD